jgi:predicted fused transcriptional regulator/phosphomethylpyrimidine kinase
MGADAALVKGGHVSGEDVLDVLVTGDAVETVCHPRVETESTHGSGCTLSAAIAAHLAEGADLAAAVRSGIDLLSRAVRYPLDVGEGPGAVHHTVSLRDRAERQPTAERVSEIVRQLADRGVSRLVPDAGMDVVGATPYAEHPAECAAVEGGLVRPEDGVGSPRGVRFGSSPTVARRLLAAREVDADLRFAAECRYDDGVAAALDSLDGQAATSASVEGEAADGSPDAVRDRVGRAFADGDSPVAVIDRAVEPATVTVFAPGSGPLSDRLVTLLEAIPDGA